MLRFSALVLIAFVGFAPLASAAPDGEDVSPEPPEFVLQAEGGAVLRDDLSEPFREAIEVRPDGKGTNRWITGVRTASVTIYWPEDNGAPASKKEPKIAAVVCPGGGYLGHSFDNEGCKLAAWLAERGIVAGVLKYRTHVGQPLGDKPLKDAQAAVEFLREKTGLRVGVVGFSAGGHLAAMTANSPPEGRAEDQEWVAFHAMMYPVTSMADDITHKFSRKLTLGEKPSEEDKARFSPYRLVTETTSPAFLVHTTDDSAVSYENSLLYVRACTDAGVEAELHVYPKGGHGWGMRKHSGTLNKWTEAFENWLVTRGFIKPSGDL